MTTLPVEPTCSAPDSALYFRPDGIIAACCASWHVLGRVDALPRASLRDIWDGAAARTLRRAVASRDWGFGCWECGALIDTGRREQSLAVEFDDIAQPHRAPFPKLMDFALSNRCNLQCVMCNGGLSSAIRAHREHRPPLGRVYDDRFFSELAEFLPHLQRASFKGGEPFLAPENARIWDLMLGGGFDCDVSVTTNGTVLNDRAVRYLRELRMSVNVSVDAVNPDLLKAIRVGVDPAALWRNIDELRSITASTGSSLTMSFCLMSSNWHELPEFLRRAREREANPNVIWVSGPAEHGIWALGPDELRRATQELRASAEDSALCEADRSVLASTAQRLESAHRPTNTAVAVGLGPFRHRSKAPSAAADRSGRPGETSSLRLTFRDEVVRAVVSPPWAEWLEPERWIGLGLEELMPTIAVRSGGAMRATMSVLADGAHRALIDFPGRPDRPSLEVVYAPSGGGSSTVVISVHPMEQP